MSSLPIRIRLTAAFAVAMAGVIGAMGLLVYLRVGGALLTSVDQTLGAQAKEALLHVQDRRGLVDPDVAGGPSITQQFARNGALARSEPVGMQALLGRADAVRAARGARFLRTVTLSPPRGEYRLLAVPVPEGGAIVVAHSLAAREEAVHRIYRELLIAGPLAVLLAALAGYGLAAAALRPVEAMRRRAARVTPSAPGVLPVPRARDEISRLAVTLNEMLSRLQAALERERRFVADASHELRTPVALLRTELELAVRRPRSQEELKHAVESALHETERLSRLADDLLMLARADEGVPLRLEQIGVAQLLETVAGRFAERARGTGREIRVAETTAAVNADRARLEQALANLVENALAHGAGPLELFAVERAGRTEIHVADRGRGFADGFLERAFDRFSQSDEARVAAGAGLGLSIVRVIAEAHGGTAGAANRPGGGADVWIVLATS